MGFRTFWIPPFLATQQRFTVDNSIVHFFPTVCSVYDVMDLTVLRQSRKGNSTATLRKKLTQSEPYLHYLNGPHEQRERTSGMLNEKETYCMYLCVLYICTVPMNVVKLNGS